MKRIGVGLMLASAFALGAPVVTAAEAPPGAIDNVDYLGTVDDTDGAVAINFLEYKGRGKPRDVMMVSGTFGLKSYDVSDPTVPMLLDELDENVFKLPGDPETTNVRAFWQNEDMDVDPKRKLVMMARDPRAYDGSTSSPDAVAGVYIVDAADPTALELKVFEELPVGHTSTCINECDFLWTGGPASNTEQAAIWPGGRPIFATDIRDLDNVTTSPVAIDTERFDGVTAYAHDVQVDERGIAWVSGRGGVRGYHTSGKHWDPLQERRRRATAFDPIPFAGGGISESAAPSSFLHNSDRPLGRNSIPGAARYGFKPGELILATEEAFGSNTCDGVGVFAIASLEGSYDGEGWRSTPEDPFRLETVSTWSPAGEEGTDIAAPFCSAHYFERQKEIVAYSWYAQGTRFLDISDPRNPIQIAYYRPDDAVSYAPYFYEDVVYVADISRGIDILRLDKDAKKAQKQRKPVKAPKLSQAAKQNVAALSNRFAADSTTSFICIIPT
ncbi:hypothetical protein [Ilumatobacter nonamiensis]|uniref:hypothetical protein n=1 Tax=Ilumatobacter nonamiensis TaxID=467093 RepID=UPI0006872A26|nr:hypothetical protein [Ilumatobacter nonamiensis]